MICSTPRHEMEITVRAGADENGIIRALDVYTLSNTGAYGEHSSTTVGWAGINPLDFTDIQKHIVLLSMLCIQMSSQQVLTVDMEQRRVFLRLNLRSMNWHTRWEWIR